MAKSDNLSNPHIGEFSPAILYKGRIWHELNNSGFYIGSWAWNGTYWVSLQLFSRHFTTALVTSSRRGGHPVKEKACRGDATGFKQLSLFELVGSR